jgi:hypothetical protein
LAKLPQEPYNSNDSSQITIQQLPNAIVEGMPYQQITPEMARTLWPEQDASDIAAISTVLQDVQLSEGFLNSKLYIQQWNLAEILLFAYVKPEKWKGTDQWRSHLGMPVLAEQLHSMLAVLQQTLFSGVRPYQVDPTSGTTIDVARAQEGLLGWALGNCGTKGGSYKQEMRWCVYDGLLYGTGAGFLGWKDEKRTRIKKRRTGNATAINTGAGAALIPPNDDELEEYPEDFEVNRPAFEYVNIRRLRVDPGCRRSDIRTAQWVARFIYLSSVDLAQLREVEGWKNIPSDDQFVRLTTPTKPPTQQNQLEVQGIDWGLNRSQKALPENRETTNDPLAKKWEVIEYWTAYRVIRIFERQLCISNETHDFGKIPFVSFNLHEAPDSFYGLGLCHLVGDFQRICQGVINAFLDDLALNLMGVYTRERGINSSAQTEWIYPGKIFQSDGGKNPFQALTRNSAQPSEALAVISQVKSWASSITGAGVGVTGQNPGKPGDMRTPGGVNLIAGGEQLRMQDLADQIADLMMVPTLEFFMEQFSKRMKPSQVRQILSEELKEAFKGDPLDVLNGQYKVSISAASRLAARMALNGSLGFIVQMLQNPGMTQQLAQSAEKIDYATLFKVIFEATGYPYYNDIVKKMSNDEMQRTLQMNAAATKPAQDAQKIAAQADAKKGVDDNQAENRALLRAQEAVFQRIDAQYEHVAGAQ